MVKAERSAWRSASWSCARPRRALRIVARKNFV